MLHSFVKRSALLFSLVTLNAVSGQQQTSQLPLLIPQWSQPTATAGMSSAPSLQGATNPTLQANQLRQNMPTANSQALQQFAARIMSEVQKPQPPQQSPFAKLARQLSPGQRAATTGMPPMIGAQQAGYFPNGSAMNYAIAPVMHDQAQGAPAAAMPQPADGAARVAPMMDSSSSMPSGIPVDGVTPPTGTTANPSSAMYPPNSEQVMPGQMIYGTMTVPGQGVGPMPNQMMGSCPCGPTAPSTTISPGCGGVAPGPILPPQSPTHADFWSTGATTQTCPPSDVWANFDCNQRPRFPRTPRNHQSCCGSLCGPGPRTWLRSEVLFGWIRGYDTPVLLTENPRGTPVGAVGLLTDPSTSVLYGGHRFGQDLRIGGRINGGMWFDESRCFGFQSDFFGLGNDSEKINVSGFGATILSRPYIDTAGGGLVPGAQILAMAGDANGQFIANTSGSILSTGPAFRWNVKACGSECGTDSCRVDLLAGYRFFRLDEGFRATAIRSPYGATVPAGSSTTFRDVIDTDNDFHGFEFGGILMRRRGRLTAEVSGTVAFGGVRREAYLDGSVTNYLGPDTVSAYPGGFVVRPEDIGTTSDREFTVLPQFRGSLSYCIACNTQLTLGYSFLYLDNLFRPGSFMTTEFDGSTLGTDPSTYTALAPRNFTETDDVIMHALSLGLTYNF